MMNTETKWGWRHVSLFTGITLGFAIVIVGLFAPPSNLPRRNMAKVYGLLLHARLEPSRLGGSGTSSITLADGVILKPERDQVIAGYILTPHLDRQEFTIEARPLQPGKTGVLYFYRGRDGGVRFDAYKPAGESSRHYSQVVE